MDRTWSRLGVTSGAMRHPWSQKPQRVVRKRHEADVDLLDFRVPRRVVHVGRLVARKPVAQNSVEGRSGDNTMVPQHR